MASAKFAEKLSDSNAAGHTAVRFLLFPCRVFIEQVQPLRSRRGVFRALCIRFRFFIARNQQQMDLPAVNFSRTARAIGQDIFKIFGVPSSVSITR